MQKNYLKRTLLILLAMAIAPLVWAEKIEVRKFEGELADLKALGYGTSAGPTVKNSNGRIQPGLEVNTWCIRETDRPHHSIKCVFGVQTLLGHESNGMPIWGNEDAVEVVFPKGIDYQFLSDAEHNCVSAVNPNLSVVAVGLWHWRKKPPYDGYANDIQQAWMIDPASKKFKAVPTKSVSCKVDGIPD
ncbi:MAG: hypothetical protein HYZ46_08600 [Nitrosomonadales bacterium]|nr:hypothetical protein [Nitrosomonadales bacterium]